MASNHIWLPLAEGKRPLVFKPGQFIYFQGEQAPQFFYIITGNVKCFISSETGDERTLTIHQAGDLIGEAAFFDGKPRVSTAVAVSHCELISVDRPQLLKVFSQHPDLAISMLEYLAHTVRLLSSHVDSTFLSADQRLARHLLKLYNTKKNSLIECTHEELGNAIGASRVTVSRAIARFVKRGFINTSYRRVELMNPNAMEEYLKRDDP